MPPSARTNILSATHCATRLRLVLRETPSDEVTKQISEMPAVIKVMESGGQYQVVIGTHAKDVYEALAQLLDLDNSTAAAPEEDIPKLIGFLKRQEANGKFFSKAMQKEVNTDMEEV